jgi:hypothetical protein
VVAKEWICDLTSVVMVVVSLSAPCKAHEGRRHVERTPPPPPSSKPELYFLLMNQKINSVYNVTAADAVLARAAAAG